MMGKARRAEGTQTRNLQTMVKIKKKEKNAFLSIELALSFKVYLLVASKFFLVLAFFGACFGSNEYEPLT